MEPRRRFRFGTNFILAVMGTTAAAYLFIEAAGSQKSETESTSRVEPRYSWHAALDVIPHVSVAVRKDRETGHWIYSYTVSNDSTSANAITKFALDPVDDVIGIVGVEHWYHVHGFANRRQAAVWAVVDVGPPPSDWDSVSLYPSVFDVQPGTVVEGFSIVSRRPPGLINYYVQGFHDIASWEEPDAPRPFDNAVTGSILGPGGEPVDSSSRQWFSSSRSRPLSADSVRSPKQAVDLVVSARVSFKPSTGVHTYYYEVRNELTSENALDLFLVTKVDSPITISYPPHWGAFDRFDGDSSVVVWFIADVGPPPTDWRGNDVYIGPFHPQPGDSVSGFSFTSLWPPEATARFYAEGFDTIPGGGHTGPYVRPKAFWEDAVTGPTLGPTTTRSEEK
jgi:hypothetical protein